VIIIAASNTPDWEANDGNVSFEAIDKDINRTSFSHTRTYTVTPGKYTFYAVAQNYVDLNGSGIASFYGHLIIKYFPEDPFTLNEPFVDATGISKTKINVRGAPVRLDSIKFSTKVGGTVFLHFDGQCFPSIGDRIQLAASNDGDWHVNDGCVRAETPDMAGFSVPFSHSRIYSVQPGTHTFYAVAENYVETAGTGVTSVYGTLTMEFYPSTDDDFCVGTGFYQVKINLEGQPVELASVQLNIPNPGKVFLLFDGTAYPDLGDRLLLAASNTVNWGVNSGVSSVEVPNSDQNHTNFAHVQVYDVKGGNYTFYAVGENYVETAGSGIADIYGNLTAIYFLNYALDIDDPQNKTTGFELKQNYPNPFNPSTQISFSLPVQEKVVLTVYNIQGEQVDQMNLGLLQPGTHELTWYANNLPAGVYFYQIRAGSLVQTRKMILLK
jgi:hypothetical protein